jgi:serine phosphatase RsbU (regulator of sigma subunit)
MYLREKKLSSQLNHKLHKELKNSTQEIQNLQQNLQQKQEELSKVKANLENTEQNLRRTEMLQRQHTDEASNMRYTIENLRIQRVSMLNNLLVLQNTLLPDAGFIKSMFPDFFVLYKPFEQTGGDFYRFFHCGDNILVACGNCGISGTAGLAKALLNMVFLQDIIQKSNSANLQAGNILDNLRSKYAHLSDHNSSYRDIDESIPVNFTVCIINQKAKTLSYAGAYGSMCLLRKSYPGTNRKEVDVHEYRGDKMNFAVSFGRRKNYTTELIELEKDDKLYLKTDGFVNQRGGTANARFGDIYLRQMFMKHANEPMIEQRHAYEAEFDKWRGQNRGNDILIIGLSLKIAGR